MAGMAAWAQCCMASMPTPTSHWVPKRNAAPVAVFDELTVFACGLPRDVQRNWNGANGFPG